MVRRRTGVRAPRREASLLDVTKPGLHRCAVEAGLRKRMMYFIFPNVASMSAISISAVC